METDPTSWIEALRHSHESLASLVGPLDVAQLEGPSYDSEWSIAQVASHLGSQAEIFNLFLDAGLSGQDPPGPGAFAPIWEVWNSRSPQAQAAEALLADASVVERFEALGDDQLERLHLNLFGMEVDATGLARMRLSEHAVHTWDIAVALDPATTVASDAVELLIDTLDLLVMRTGRPDGQRWRVHVSTTSPERHFILEIADRVTLQPSEHDEGPPELCLPAEALVRLVYGRLDPAHMPPGATEGVALDDVRRLFPGF